MTILSPTKTYFQEKLAGVLRAIVDDPSDDVSRLVYADLCEEYGDESERARAEFIRLSLELAKWGADGGVRNPCREIVLDGSGFDIDAGARRQGELVRQGYFAWSPFDDEFHKKYHQAISYRRGFVAVVSCTDAEFRKHGPLLVRRCPLEEVRIVDKKAGSSFVGSLLGWYGQENYDEAGQEGNRVNDDDDIPLDVWKELDGGSRGRVGKWWWYQSREEANRDLSRAYLRWARKQPDPTVSNPEGLD